MGTNPDKGNHGSSALTPPGQVTAFYHVLAMQYMVTISEALGKNNETKYWQSRNAKAKQSYHIRFFNKSASGYSPCINNVSPYDQGSTCFGTSSAGSQTSNSMTLAIGVPPAPVIREIVAKSLVSDVLAFKNRTTVGVVGMGFLFDQLDAAGYGDVALNVLRGDQYPSIGHMASQNWTTLCENLACTEHDAGGGSGSEKLFTLSTYQFNFCL